MAKYYSVYEVGTDRPICIHGTGSECAKAMGISVQSFWHYLVRIRTGKRVPKKIEIFQDEEDDDLCDG
jgi:hypothetical protein